LQSLGLPCEFATLTASRVVKEHYLVIWPGVEAPASAPTRSQE
jgi:hypothetical protein